MNPYDFTCYYDIRSNANYFDDSGESELPPNREGGCYCDNCSNGNTPLALEIIRLTGRVPSLTKEKQLPSQPTNKTKPGDTMNPTIKTRFAKQIVTALDSRDAKDIMDMCLSAKFILNRRLSTTDELERFIFDTLQEGNETQN